MKKYIVIGALLTAVASLGLIAEAWAKCPPGTSYQCTQGFNGKVICGCR